MSTTDELLPTASAAETRRVLGRLARPHRGLAVAVSAALVCATVSGLAGPWLLGQIVEDVVRHRAPSSITAPALALALVAVAQGVFTLLGDLLVARLGETMLADLREQVVEHALGLRLEQAERAGSGDLIARVSGDVSVIATAARSALPGLVSAGLTIGLTFVGLLALDWRLALAAAVAVPVQLHTLRWYLRRSAPIYAAERIAEGARTQQLYESVDGAATVRAFGLGEAHAASVAERSQAALDLSISAVRVRTRLFGRLNVAELAGLTAILVSGFLLVRADTITVGAATAAALYFHRLFDPVNALLSLVDDAQAASAAAARLVGVAHAPLPSEPARAVRPADGSLRARGIRHAYRPGHDVLDGIELDVAPGEHIALIGASGAGKTTLAKLVAGIHPPTAGEIKIGGASFDQMGPAVARRAVALLTQETHVFSGTLADDLRLGEPTASDDELERALTRVGAAWLGRLPHGLQTIVGDGGHRLTAAQAQQLALARLLLADPVVAVLDEATADAGSAGARELEAAARVVLEGRTALVVAHRLTQAAAADRILVLERGRIVEQGTHDELAAANGTYAALWRSWRDPRSEASLD